MDSSPTKRILTDNDHATRLASDVPRSDALPDDLAASLRNIGRRVRKNVSDGYRTQPSAPPTPYSSPMKQPPAPASVDHQAPPSNVTLHEIFSSSSSGHYTPTSSPSKRRRQDDPIAGDNPSSDDESTVDMELANQGDVMEAIPSDALQGAPRPVKPLRRSAKVLMGASAVGPLRYPGMDGVRSHAVGQTTNVEIKDVFLDSASDTVPQRDNMEL
ncbi:hypothetical protein BV22DRAFT_1125704 [Leucogyrophana mollusca]|uniref:Uncharacterized protein n=1 Tax=Leucogyrophana mollusca TaxID=85980 RepID=A0ACB8BW15_9AGAM|nr:hypothetical protein BV22DRAFT_1125704 [Leucogyrophana mollusca]